MMSTTIKRRKGALLYLFCSCSFLLFYFISSFDQFKSFPQSVGGNVYPWQMMEYDEYDCGCPRSGRPIGSQGQKSLCSDWSTSRGPNQRVVSYTLYGDLNDTNVYEKYYSTLENRLKDVEKYYKGFIVRLYHNLTTLPESQNKKFLCHLYCEYPFFDPCQVKNLHQESIDSNSTDLGKVKDSWAKTREVLIGLNKKGLPLQALGPVDIPAFSSGRKSYETLMIGKMWRFLVMGDPLVTEFLVRDVDSSILEREVAAVEQWLYNSTALVHAMRDHPSHNGLMLAGLWGGSRSRGADKLNNLLKQMLRWPPRNLWDYDQILLKRVVWPEVIDDVLVHDSYFCGNPRFQSKHRSEPFPTQRKEKYFVGWGVFRNPEMEGIVRCPRQCRPFNHQDWILC